MRFLSHLLRLLGVVLVLLAGVLFLALALRLLLIEEITRTLTFVYDSPRIRLILGTVGGVVLVITLVAIRMIFQQIQKERTIAFRNPDGEVTVALEAIEEFIRKLGNDLSGVKEIKPYVKATRAGIFITLRATLWADTHIPEVTETLQGVIRGHIHEILGVEEPITIHVHVGKLIQRSKGRSDVVEEKVV